MSIPFVRILKLPEDLPVLNYTLVSINNELRRLSTKKLNIAAFQKYLPIFKKGDLLTLRTGEVFDRLSIGADNAVLMADSTELSGIKWTSAVYLTNGTYTPTLNNVTNLDGSTAYTCQYLRVGSTITVSGKVDVDPTAGVATQLGISLPIASNFANAQECAGAAFCPTIANQGAAILADITNNRAEMQWIAVDLTNQPMYFTFTYMVI